ncbi:MAG TPA: carboxypeptidase-like regulatory domain-containing protein, partial [Bacteroidota bacterium]
MVKLVRFSSLILSLLILTSTSVFSRSNSNAPRDLDLRAAKIAQLLSLEKFSRSRTAGDQFLSPAGTGAISGKVVGAENAPIPEAWVVAWSMSIIDPAKNFARTDAEGNYVIDGLPTGNYIVAAEAEGYFPEFYNNARSMMDATPVHVEEPNTVTGIDFSLELRSAGGGAISGMVTDGAGNPIVEAGVNVFSMTNPF